MEELNAIQKLTRDLRDASTSLSLDEARYLVDSYYQIQEYRKASDNQVRALTKSEEPHQVLSWLANQTDSLEGQIKRVLDKWTKTSPDGIWLQNVTGIGPVIAAGLLAHIDIEKAPTAGHIWSYAGLVPGVEWKKGEKRPWNASLKRLCFLIGESFVKVSGLESDVYGKLYIQRKKQEIAFNDEGKFSEQARAKLEKFNIRKSTDAYPWYAGQYPAGTSQSIADLESAYRVDYLNEARLKEGEGQPMLPLAHIHARAKRWPVKLFLSHLQHVMYYNKYKKEPPKPYVIEHLGHVHFIGVPGLSKGAAK